MTVHVIRCADRWDVDDGLIPGGPIIAIDDARPNQVVIDDKILRVASCLYSPEHERTDRDGDTFICKAWCEATMPMENGAALTIHWSDGEVAAVSVGVYEKDDEWFPLRETPDALIKSHRDCTGNHCADGGCASWLIEEPEGSYRLADIMAAWRRCGVKPIDLTKPASPIAKSYPEPVVSELDRAIRSGRTVTLEEYRRMTAS